MAQAATRLGRLNRFDFVRRGRRQALSLMAREGFTVRAQFPLGIGLDLPCWDCNLLAALLAGRVFDPMLVSVLRSVACPGAVVVDGGAHIGIYAITAAKLMEGQGTVIAFEPDPRNFALLQRNINLNGMQSAIQAEQIALSDSDGETEMWVAEDVSTCGSLVSMHLPSHRCIRVRSTCLDSYVSFMRIPRIDLLKLDLEGAEPACLRGARKSVQLANTLVFELNAPRLKAQGLIPHEVAMEFISSGNFSEAFLLDESGGRAIEWDGGRDLELLLEVTGFVNVLLSRDGGPFSLGGLDHTHD